jgi:prevent-host-death family protein
MTETISAAKFKEQCLALMDSVGPEGIVITKRGKPVAKLVSTRCSDGDLIGALKGKLVITGDIVASSGAWDSDEWNAQP